METSAKVANSLSEKASKVHLHLKCSQMIYRFKIPDSVPTQEKGCG